MATHYISLFAHDPSSPDSVQRASEAAIAGATALTNDVRVSWDDTLGPDAILQCVRAAIEILQNRGRSSGVLAA